MTMSNDRSTVSRGDPHSRFARWSAEELRQRDEALSSQLRPDFSGRETLEDYGDHRFRFIRREKSGRPEQHDEVIDVVVVYSGRGVLHLGGTMIGRTSGSGTESLGTGIEGGEKYPLEPGDVVHIPETIPHAFLVPEGGHLTYVLLKIPAVGKPLSGRPE